jgi:hypothetical protein
VNVEEDTKCPASLPSQETSPNQAIYYTLVCLKASSNRLFVRRSKSIRLVETLFLLARPSSGHPELECCGSRLSDVSCPAWRQVRDVQKHSGLGHDMDELTPLDTAGVCSSNRVRLFFCMFQMRWVLRSVKRSWVAYHPSVNCSERY